MVTTYQVLKVLTSLKKKQTIIYFYTAPAANIDMWQSSDRSLRLGLTEAMRDSLLSSPDVEERLGFVHLHVTDRAVLAGLQVTDYAHLANCNPLRNQALSYSTCVCTAHFS